MYLAKYIICAFIFAAALLFAIRTCGGTSLHTWHGKLARSVLTMLLAAAVVVIWYYATKENLDNIKVVWVARVGSALLAVLALPDVWRDGKPQKQAEKKEQPPIAEAEQGEDSTEAEDKA